MSDGSSRDDGDDAPLADLAGRVSERRAERGRGREESKRNRSSPGDGGANEDPFEEMSVGEIDEEAIWATLESPDDAESRVGVGGSGGAAASADPDAASEAAAGDRVVEKAEYCQRCPHLADPPELACTREGTRIVEVVDGERFRVRNCPMVEE